MFYTSRAFVTGERCLICYDKNGSNDSVVLGAFDLLTRTYIIPPIKGSPKPTPSPIAKSVSLSSLDSTFAVHMFSTVSFARDWSAGGKYIRKRLRQVSLDNASGERKAFLMLNLSPVSGFIGIASTVTLRRVSIPNKVHNWLATLVIFLHLLSRSFDSGPTLTVIQFSGSDGSEIAFSHSV